MPWNRSWRILASGIYLTALAWAQSPFGMVHIEVLRASDDRPIRKALVRMRDKSGKAAPVEKQNDENVCDEYSDIP